MSIRLAAIALAIAGLNLAQPALALEVPIELEGTVEEIAPTADTMVVMGIPVTVPRSTPIVTPTGDINALATELGTAVGRPNVKPLVLMRRFRVDGVDVLPAQLPGRSQIGFLGATATIVGSAVLDDATGALVSITATSVFAEPAENVILGGITSVSCSTPDCSGPSDVLTNLGRPLQRLDDPRIPALPVADDFGFAIDLSLLSGPLPSAVEGYYGEDQVMHYHTLSIDAGTSGISLLNQGAEVSILRAQCDEGDGELDFEIRGATHDPSSGLVEFTDSATGAFLGDVDVETVIDEVSGQPTRFGTFRFRDTVDDPTDQGCPANVTATFVDGGNVSAESPVN
ncbi:MAG: hypothetical protein KDG52_11825 [Rhodocyclaceae bacterium]|nr:hypothetical protein [Rhodocyclaceae bacterium]